MSDRDPFLGNADVSLSYCRAKGLWDLFLTILYNPPPFEKVPYPHVRIFQKIAVMCSRSKSSCLILLMRAMNVLLVAAGNEGMGMCTVFYRVPLLRSRLNTNTMKLSTSLCNPVPGLPDQPLEQHLCLLSIQAVSGELPLTKLIFYV